MAGGLHNHDASNYKLPWKYKIKTKPTKSNSIVQLVKSLKIETPLFQE